MSNPMSARCGLEDCDCGHTIEVLLKALEAAVGYLPDKNPAMHQFWRDWLPRARTAIKAAKGVCQKCGGRGGESDGYDTYEWRHCTTCGGTGRVLKEAKP